ncbi:MAG: hypothetical protein DWQ10_13250 [Calditrichaeota bacterium]|nr:MAG: hypothetical protein DWQ10_13250 [Calditrichota bacterium]
MTNQSEAKFDNLKSLLQQNPDSIIFARVAEALLAKGKTDEAIRICEEGIRKHPFYVTGHMVLGKCYLRNKMFDLAEKEFKRVLLFEPKHIAAHKYTGDLMKEAGWAEACLKSYGEILKIDPLNKELQQEYEKIKQDVAKEQKVVAPADTVVADSSAQSDFKITQFSEPGSAKAKPEETEDFTPMETSSINIEDDLFVEDEKSSQSIEMNPVDLQKSENVTSILDDIFEDRSGEDDSDEHVEILVPAKDPEKRSEKSEPENKTASSEPVPEEKQDEPKNSETKAELIEPVKLELSETKHNDIVSEKTETGETKNEQTQPEEHVQKEDTDLEFTIPDDDILQGIKVKPYDPTAPDEPVEHLSSDAPPQKNAIPDSGDLISGDETIEFNKMDSLEKKALENLKPISDSDIDFISQEEASGNETEGEDFFETLDKEQSQPPEEKDKSTLAKTRERDKIDQATQTSESAQKSEESPSESKGDETPEQIIDQIFGTATPSQKDEPETAKDDSTEKPEEPNTEFEDTASSVDVPGLDEKELIEPLKPAPDNADASDEEDADDKHEEVDAMIAAVDEASENISKPKSTADEQDDKSESKPVSHDTSSFEIEKDRIVTPTLGEIYAAQGQYAKAVNVFEVLLKKNPENTMYQDKVDQLRQRLNENANA